MANLPQCYSFIDVEIRRFARGQVVPTGQIVPVCIPVEMRRYVLPDGRHGTINVHFFDNLDANRASTLLRVTRAASYLSMCLFPLQLPGYLHSEIVVRVSMVARDLIMAGSVRGSGLSMRVTIRATTMRQPVRRENQDGVGQFHDFTDGHGIYDARDQSGRAVSRTQSSVQSLEKVRYEAPDSESNTQTQCSICLEEFEAGSEVTRLPCLHVYHGDCIDKWVQRSLSCPLCRFALPRTS